MQILLQNYRKLYKNVLKLSRFCNTSENKMKILNVAEKNDAAKTISGLLSHGTSTRREGLSVYNKIYEFDATVRGQNSTMVMTSVSGHLLTHAFVESYKNWMGCDPIALFDAQVIKKCPENFEKIKATLQREIRNCQMLIIWTDCDREGENIGFEIIDVCRAVNRNISVYRAKFSEITTASVKRALDNLIQPDEKQNQAVDVRSELDLRIGAAFTRFQTMRFQRMFPEQVASKLVSYGSCQFPTLGFVAQRYKEAENFIPQTFWKIKVLHTVDDVTVEFLWSRKRLFDKSACEAFFMLCQSNPNALVLNTVEKPKSKWRPVPLDTVELEKLGSRKLHITAKETMTIAEKLYTKGIISYPRTETNIFSNEINLNSLVEQQTSHPDWGGFANKVLNWGVNPRQGKKSDQAHPPIHPTKLTTDLGGNEKRVYELIVRHFLACVSRDARGSETIVDITIADEEFTATGLCIYERNYLEVYPYDRWSAKEIHNYKRGNTFIPTEISMPEGATTAPQMLTEADLIALMEKHGIGTDATHAEHINTIKERGYIGEIEGKYLVPGTLGMGLVEGYDAINLPLAQPKLRAGLEADLKLICEGRRNPREVLQEQISKYRDAYVVITQKVKKLDESLSARLNEIARDPPQTSITSEKIFKCPKCDESSMVLRARKDNTGYFISCSGFPACKNTVWLDSNIVKDVKISNSSCSRCGSDYKKLIFTFKQRSILTTLGSAEDAYETCIVCDENIKNLLTITDDKVKRNVAARSQSSSIGSNRNGQTNSSVLTSNRNTTASISRTNSRNEQFQREADSNSNGYSNNRNVGWFGDSTNQTRNDNRNQNDWSHNPRNDQNSSWNNQNSSSRSTEDVKCTKCNASGKKLIVKRDGPNKGRTFYICSVNNTECNFFKWGDDETIPQSYNQSTTYEPTPTNNNRRSNNSGPSNAGAGTSTRRKCGLCRQEGHTRNKCPRRSDLDLMT